MVGADGEVGQHIQEMEKHHHTVHNQHLGRCQRISCQWSNVGKLLIVQRSSRVLV